jgi:hypothetical protein
MVFALRPLLRQKGITKSDVLLLLLLFQNHLQLHNHIKYLN